jgi:hypothetical protein
MELRPLPIRALVLVGTVAHGSISIERVIAVETSNLNAALSCLNEWQSDSRTAIDFAVRFPSVLHPAHTSENFDQYVSRAASSLRLNSELFHRWTENGSNPLRGTVKLVYRWCGFYGFGPASCWVEYVGKATRHSINERVNSELVECHSESPKALSEMYDAQIVHIFLGDEKDETDHVVDRMLSWMRYLGEVRGWKRISGGATSNAKYSPFSACDSVDDLDLPSPLITRLQEVEGNNLRSQFRHTNTKCAADGCKHPCLTLSADRYCLLCMSSEKYNEIRSDVYTAAINATMKTTMTLELPNEQCD